ncbi:hypothetical protein IE53DRAFT_273410 [Violaceomyces palustris]|uniref:Uncharacterized protein n=1 Tax=Violaceomyces palustris TaxID=1673888 RepID=A0ACD0P3B0_9BASI|nr:hypothetical protein IE53DRAFT_273410 [Violaceomyces palustris]
MVLPSKAVSYDEGSEDARSGYRSETSATESLLKDPATAFVKHSSGQLGEQVTPHTMDYRVDRAHIELIQQVQHELRTPVHGMLGMLDSLRSELRELYFEDRHKRNSILVQMESLIGLGERLQHVLDDFKDFATETIAARDAEQNHNLVPEEPVDLGELLDEVAAKAWAAQVRQIRAEGGEDARLPPPPELILQTETSLRGWKTVVSTDLIKRLAHKLISNALRFTTEGFVEISLAPAIASPRDEDVENQLDAEEPPKASKNFIELVIEDSGEGMTEEFLSDHLFEPFVKADAFKSGAGLSMTLCSSLVRNMGGAMHVSSDKGRGTIVNVKIPVETLPETIINPAPPSQSDQLIYLYGFEGYGLQRLAQVISAQLATFGNLYCTSHIEDADYLLLPEEACLEVEGGIEAILAKTKPGVKIGVLQAHEDAGIEYAAFKNGSRRPTFVTRKPFGPRCFANLLRLAEQSGAQDTRTKGETVRDSHGHLGYTAPVDPNEPDSVLPEGAGTPIASGSPDKEKASADLKTDHLESVADAEEGLIRRGSSLPSGDKLADLVVSPKALDEVLRAPQPPPKMQHPQSASVVGDLMASSSVEDARDFSVLCCEDNPLNMRILTQMLKQSKIEFHQAVDGEEAVKQFKKHLPAVTLLDINMPKMMGFEACEEMRRFVSEELGEKGKGRTFKIIAVTALSDDFHRSRGFECGMDEWYSKPLKMAQLRKELKEWKKEFDDRMAESTPPLPCAPSPVTSSSTSPKREHRARASTLPSPPLSGTLKEDWSSLVNAEITPKMKSVALTADDSKVTR